MADDVTTHSRMPFQALKDRGFEVLYVSHAAAILAGDFPSLS